MDKKKKSCFNTKGFISEHFYTADRKFAFEKCGSVYLLYEESTDWYFSKEFRSFHAMQEYITEARGLYGKTQKRYV